MFSLIRPLIRVDCVSTTLLYVPRPDRRGTVDRLFVVSSRGRFCGVYLSSFCRNESPVWIIAHKRFSPTRMRTSTSLRYDFRPSTNPEISTVFRFSGSDRDEYFDNIVFKETTVLGIHTLLGVYNKQYDDKLVQSEEASSLSRPAQKKKNDRVLYIQENRDFRDPCMIERRNRELIPNDLTARDGRVRTQNLCRFASFKHALGVPIKKQQTADHRLRRARSTLHGTRIIIKSRCTRTCVLWVACQNAVKKKTGARRDNANRRYLYTHAAPVPCAVPNSAFIIERPLRGSYRFVVTSSARVLVRTFPNIASE